MLPALALIPRRSPRRSAQILCWFGLILAVAEGCSDDQVDPIVRVGQGSSGADGSGGKSGTDAGDLCQPCSARSDCADTCAQLIRNGDRFCSQPCGDSSGHCPAGYICADVLNVSSMQCVPETGDCTFVVP